MTTLFRIDDRDLLTSVLAGEGIALAAADILDGLTAEQAHAKPHGLPHSIADIVAHLCYWQEWINSAASAGYSGIAKHAADGWPPVAANDWDGVRTRFLQSVEEAKRMAAGSPALGERLLPPGVEKPASLIRESHGSSMLRVAVHNSHHLGQIVTIRQLMELWPPPSGTITW